MNPSATFLILVITLNKFQITYRDYLSNSKRFQPTYTLNQIIKSTKIFFSIQGVQTFSEHFSVTDYEKKHPFVCIMSRFFHIVI